MTKILKKVQLSTEQSTPKSAEPTKGTQTNPYTEQEMRMLQEQSAWNGGYVEGMGYIIPVTNFILPTVYIYGDIRPYIVTIARQYIGINNHDNSDLIGQWLQAVGFSFPNAWCAAFVSAVFREAGANGANSAAVADWVSWGDQTTEPQPGDIAIYPENKHVGIISGVFENDISVISGNSTMPEEGTNRFVTEKTFTKGFFEMFVSNH